MAKYIDLVDSRNTDIIDSDKNTETIFTVDYLDPYTNIHTEEGEQLTNIFFPIARHIPKDFLTKKWYPNLEARMIGVDDYGLNEEEIEYFGKLFIKIIRVVPVIYLPKVFCTCINKNAPEANNFELVDYFFHIERIGINEDKHITYNSNDVSFDVVRYFLNHNATKHKFHALNIAFYDKINKKYLKVADTLIDTDNKFIN